MTDQRGNDITQNVYGSGGRVIQQTDARGHDSDFGWDPQAQTATFTDARGHDWTYAYSNGMLVQVEDSYRDLTIYGYDFELNRTTTTICRDRCAGEGHQVGECPDDANCYTTTYVYDEDGNLIEEDDDNSLSYVKSWHYNADNTLENVTDGRSHTTRYEYDSDGNLTCVLVPIPSGTTCSGRPRPTRSPTPRTGPPVC